MSFDFLRPYLLLLLPLVLLPRFYPRRSPWNRVMVLRSLVLGLLVLALAGPVLVSTEKDSYQVLILDGSESLGSSSRVRLQEVFREWKEKIVSPARAAVICLGDPKKILLSDSEGISVVALGDAQGTSPLGAALEAGLRQIPTGSSGALTLVTDGLATDPHWGNAVRQLVGRGIPVKVVGLSGETKTPRLVGLDPQPLLRVGQTAQLSATLVGEASGLLLRLSDDQGHELARSREFACTGRVSVGVEFEPAQAGFLSVRAEVLDVRTLKPVSAFATLSRTLAVQAPLNLLYLGGRVTGAATKLHDLLGRGFVVTDGSSLTLDVRTNLAGYDLVMVDDRTVSGLPIEFQAHLTQAVRHEGLGLFYSGGRAAFGAGGYDHTPISDLLPVDIIQRAEKQDPSTALVLIIDTSGSMMGSRIELAKQVARLASRRLKAHDRIGIVEFYGNKHWALPLQSAANKISVDRAIGRMQATGGTVLFPALEEAYYGLKNVTTRFKHIVLITDAGVEDADYEGLVRQIARDNINVTTVLVGAQGHSKSLLDMANWGGGRFYAASDRYALPEILLKQASTSDLPSYKEGSYAVTAQGGRSWWGGLDGTALSPLSGYVETQLRPGAELVMEVAGTSHPLLASWQSGAGRVTAMTTELLGDGTANWRSWPEYGRWLSRLVSRTAGNRAPFAFNVERRGEAITVTASRLLATEGLQPGADLLDEAGNTTSSLKFNRLSPDWFEATFALSSDKTLKLKAQALAADAVAGPGTLLVSDPHSDLVAEQQVDPAEALDLERLASVTGGSYQEASSSHLGALLRPESLSTAKLMELWAYAALLALLAYIAEIFLRRRSGSAHSSTSFRA